MTDPTSSTLAEAVQSALGGLATKPQDGAAVRLAQRYAEEIDASPDLLVKLGPALLAVLDSLGMTPKGRAALVGKEVSGERDGDHGDDCKCLQCQRKRRGVRRDRAAAVDSAAG